jgi:RHS repeat-associated protein
VLAQYEYYPFGEEASSTGSTAAAERRRFTGHERDLPAVQGSLELDYMHARYYAGAWGRFLSVDPVLDIKRSIREPQSWNRYSYVVNNPINRTDPDGRVDEGQYMERLFREQQMVGEGKVTEEQYWTRRKGEGVGTLVGVAAVGVALGGPPAWQAAGQFLFRHLGATMLTMSLFGGGAAATHQSLQRAAQGGGPTVQVVTNLTQSPAANRGLSAAVGEGAQALANAARSGPGVRTFVANIPQALIKGLQQARLLEVRRVTMNGVTGTEYRFAPGAAQYINDFFKEKQ